MPRAPRKAKASVADVIAAADADVAARQAAIACTELPEAPQRGAADASGPADASEAQVRPVPAAGLPAGGRLVAVGGGRVRVLRPGSPRAETVRGRDLPDRTDVWCWHCCHPFDGRPVPMPVAYDERRDTFRVKGTFCSFACVKAYGRALPRALDAGHLTAFHARCQGPGGRPRAVRAAPHRLALRAFGGYMSIEDFRAASGSGVDWLELPDRVVLQSHVLHETDASKREIGARQARRPAPDLSAAVSFRDVSTKNEALRLKRPRPLQNRNTLERTMGLAAAASPQPPSAPAPSG